MEEAAGGAIRPWLWVLAGSAGVVVGAVFAVIALVAATEPQDISRMPQCRVLFADDCLTERDAVIERRGYVRRDWLSREQKWYAAVAPGVPGLERGERLELVVPRQPGRDELAGGVRVRVTFYEDRPALVRLPSGRALETEGHPRRYAPTMGYLGLFALGGGAFGVATGWRTGRRQGFWRKTSRSRVRFGAASVLATAGMVGALAQVLLGSSRWFGVAGALIGTALGLWAVVAVRRRSRH